MILMAMVMTQSTVAKYCLYGDDPGCAFECHCAVEAECGGSGVCTSGCEQTGTTPELKRSWTGDTCQIGNIAFMKHANQTTDLFQYMYLAGNAVDGRTSGVLEFCTHTGLDRSSTGQWWVDLGGLYNIYNVTIYIRTDCCRFRLSYINVGVISENNIETTCDRLDQEPTSNPIVLTCQSPLIGRYVHIARYGGREIQFLSLCEVIVIGHKYIDCSKADCPAEVQCNDVTGCSGCIGTYPPYCKTECDDGFYGTNCEETCGNCADGTVCDKTRGCFQGCNDGFYGQGCRKKCGQCLHVKCNQTDGVCPECQLWWIDNQCMTSIDLPRQINETTEDTSITNNSITVIWQSLSSVPINLAQYYQYTVRYKQRQASDYTNGPSIPHTGDPVLTGTVTGLDHNTEYYIIIVPQRVMRGETDTDPDTHYRPVSVKTLCNAPSLSPNAMDVVKQISTERLGGLPHIVVSLQDRSTLDSGCERIQGVSLQYKILEKTAIIDIPLVPNENTYVINTTKFGRYEVRITVTNNENMSISLPKFITLGDFPTDQTIAIEYCLNYTEFCSSCPRHETKAVLYLNVVIALGVLLTVSLGIIIALALMLCRKEHKAKSQSEHATEAVNSSQRLPDEEISGEIFLESLEAKADQSSYETLKNRKTGAPDEVHTYEEL